MRPFRRSHPIALSLAILAGVFLQSTNASAGETRDIVVAGGCSGALRPISNGCAA